MYINVYDETAYWVSANVVVEKKTELIKRNKPTTLYNQAQNIIYQDFIKSILMLLNQNSKMNAELKKFVWPVGCISYNINIS